MEEKGISFKKLEHEAVYTIEDIEKAGIEDKESICKNLFLRDAKGKEHFLVTVPGEKRVDLRVLAEKIGSSKLSFASPERLMKYLGVEPGSVSPLGALNDESRSVTVVFDEDLQGMDAVGVHPNDNTASVWLSFPALRGLIEEHGNEVVLVKLD